MRLSLNQTNISKRELMTVDAQLAAAHWRTETIPKSVETAANVCLYIFHPNHV